MPRFLKIARLALREALLPVDLVRIPEPTAEMNARESVEGFHDAGASSLLSIYHFNALAVHALAPRGAHVLDLGSGTGQFLMYLARRRPDLTITGIEFAENMVQLGREVIARAGLDQRVRLVKGDMRAFRGQCPATVDLVSSIFALHHLETRDDLDTCLYQIAGTLQVDGAGLWVFDHARPRRRDTAQVFPELFTPEAAPTFREDSRNSLRASWSFDELAASLGAAARARIRSEKARLLPLYQIHWLEPARGGSDDVGWVEADELDDDMRMQARNLRRLFRSCPERVR